jgi:putative GTP pyrophosphokinase
MAADYETEKTAFRDFYDASRSTLDAANTTYMTLIRSLLATDEHIAGVKVEGRVKDREECLSKFRRKYQTNIEKDKKAYAIQEHITDLIGLRVVCFYEDEVERVRKLVEAEFHVISVTDKTAQMEDTEASFGYKGLHLDLKLSDERQTMREYAACAEFPFELQIRTVVQDSWSVLDHKIKYKKSIPNNLKRRINTLAALFELADREFRAIRDGTAEAISATEEYATIDSETVAEPEASAVQPSADRAKRGFTPLDAFSMLRIAGHFFNNVEFEAHKIDGFTEEVVSLEPTISRGKFNYYLRETIADVRRYKEEFEARTETNAMNPFTEMRHCLYKANPKNFAPMLTNRARDSFDSWVADNIIEKKPT